MLYKMLFKSNRIMPRAIFGCMFITHMHVNIHIFIQKHNKYVYLPRNLSRQPTDDKKLYKNSKQTMR